MLAAENISARPIAPLAKTRPLVFLAEDDKELRCLLTSALRESGYDVITASTGHDMLKLLTAASRSEIPIPDVLVMDVRMPRCSGIDVLGALRLAEWRQPIVMITGFGDPELRARAARYGASVILDKPIDSDDLIDMVDSLLLRADPAICSMDPADESLEAEPETVRCPTMG